MIQTELIPGMHPSWFPIAGYPRVHPLLVELNTEILPKEPYRPAREDIFKVFRMPVHNIKVVILGQDPYFNNDATGLAFQTKLKKVPKSLEVIYKAIENDGYLSPDIDEWESQGVFLLNTALTVRAGKAGTHTRYWEDFTKRVVNYISNVDESVIWMMWGKRAQMYANYVRPSSQNVLNILQAPHPAAEAYSGNKAGFLSCGHFAKANRILSNSGKTPIQW